MAFPFAPAGVSHGAVRQRSNLGAALVEFTVAAPPLLLLAMLAIEVAHWHLSRQQAYVALLEAARAGATQHGHPAAIAHAYARHAPAASGLAHARQQANPESLPWRIEVLQPTAAALRAHRRAGLAVAGAAGRPAVSNDYQAEYHAAHGGAAGQTIFDANTLHLRLTQPHRPLSPLTRAVLKQTAAAAGPCARQALKLGWLALQLELRIEMQSHPVDWHAPPAQHARVNYGTWDCGRYGP